MGLILSTIKFYGVKIKSENNLFAFQLADIDLLASLQIIFFCKPVLCQARDKVLPDIQSIWSDKTIFPHLL